MGGRVRIPPPPGRAPSLWSAKRRDALRQVTEFAERTQAAAGQPGREARLTALRARYAKETWKCGVSALRARYLRARECLAGATQATTDAWLSRWLRPEVVLLPECIRGPEGKVLDPTASAAACIDHLQQVGRIGWRHGDQAALNEADARLRAILDRANLPGERRRRLEHPTHDERVYSREELKVAEGRIRLRAGTIRISHAAHCAPLEGWAAARLAVINLGRDMETTTHAANEWLGTLSLKPGNQIG